MTDQEYLQTQTVLLLQWKTLQGLDLPAFIERINAADALGPVLEPTLHRAARHNMLVIKELAEKANAFASVDCLMLLADVIAHQLSRGDLQ